MEKDRPLAIVVGFGVSVLLAFVLLFFCNF